MVKWKYLHNLRFYLLAKHNHLCLIGPNGAGKSTILHSIYGFTNIFSGQIEIDGKKEITNLSPAEKLKISVESLTFFKTTLCSQI